MRVAGVEAVIYVSGLSPSRTRARLLERLPLRSTARADGALVSVDVDLGVAPEGHRRVLGAGEVAYWPPAPALVIAVELVKLASPATPLGFVVEGLDGLRQLRGTYEAELRPADR